MLKSDRKGWVSIIFVFTVMIFAGRKGWLVSHSNVFILLLLFLSFVIVLSVFTLKRISDKKGVK